MRYFVPILFALLVLACGAPAALLPTVTETPQDLPQDLPQDTPQDISTPTQISRHVTLCWNLRDKPSLDGVVIKQVCNEDVTILARFGGWAMVERGLWVCARAWGEKVSCY